MSELPEPRLDSIIEGLLAKNAELTRQVAYLEDIATQLRDQRDSLSANTTPAEFTEDSNV